MTALPRSPEFLEVARRLVWFCEPDQALDDPYLFLAHVMTYGTLEDIVTVRRTLGLEPFKEALLHAPTGVFDIRSWTYWNLLCGLEPPPLPGERRL